ncbi:MAG: hypothetical protein Kow0090_08140 [Myxococcota bacterium]
MKKHLLGLLLLVIVYAPQSYLNAQFDSERDAVRDGGKEVSESGADAVKTASAAGVSSQPVGEDQPASSKSEAATPTKEEGRGEEGAGSIAESIRQGEIKSVEESYSVRLKTLESKVNDLKEKIFRSKARLTLLAETVISGALTGAKARIYHKNEMSSSFILKSVTYTLDGTPIYTKIDKEGDLAEQEEIEILNAPVVPGNHSISVSLVYSGNGRGIFTYLDGYRFKVKSSYVFQAQEGKITEVKVVGYERGGLTLDLKDRPAVRYDVKIETDVEGIKKARESFQEGEADEESQ